MDGAEPYQALEASCRKTGAQFCCGVDTGVPTLLENVAGMRIVIMDSLSNAEM